ncbi:Intraflagellar transport protein -like protein [Sarcoptes scabiei]|uniref:Intraflagellar transport protein 122 homolog n=1 Tax=Sarcoptes scabiei TaxID=52283 RepID=A0A834R489_SARSC|nr:Intraflagellar transport protein -like protein [Sarcoptes scabiei]
MKITIEWEIIFNDKNDHPICIYDAKFSPNGENLLIAVENKIHVHEADTGTLIQTLKGHKDTILVISFANDGKRFATGSIDKQVIIWTHKWEAILKYTHNESVRCLQFNPCSYQILSCTNSDLGLWSPEQKNVSKIKISNPINCCCWNDDGVIFALGHNNGLVSIRFKDGEEKTKFDRRGSIWGLNFYRSKERKEERLFVIDWLKTLTIFNLDNNQLELYTNDGISLAPITTQNSWIMSCNSNRSRRIAFTCQNGLVSIIKIDLKKIFAIDRNHFAFRESMINVIVEDLFTKTKTLIECNDFVQKIAIYKDLLAIQLPNKIHLYESDDLGLKFLLKEKISIQFTCRALILSSKNLIYCQDNRIKSINFFGQLEKEWRTKSSIRFMKTGGGVPQNESILIGLNDGQVLMIFLSKLFPIQLIHLSNPIRAIEISCKRKKLAIVDDHNDCHVYDLQTKKLLFKESDIKSIAWNDQFEDLLCFTSSRLIGIRMHDFPTQTIELLDYNNNKNSNNHPQQHHDNINNNVLFDAKEDDGGDGDHENIVIGYSGSNLSMLNRSTNTISSMRISCTKLMMESIQRECFNEAFRLACLDVAVDDWKILAKTALSKGELKIGQKCLARIGEWPDKELIYSHLTQTSDDGRLLKEEEKQLFLAKFYAYQGLFSESAKLFKKIQAPQLAMDMFADLQMYEQAKEFQSSTNQHAKNSSFLTSSSSSSSSKRMIADQLLEPQQSTTKTATFRILNNGTDFNDLKALSKIYIAKGDYDKAFEIIAQSDVQSIMMFVEQIDKGEVKLLTLIAENFIKNGDFENAIQIYRKNGDFKRLASTYIQNGQWDEALKIANDIPKMKEEIYLPYAMWLAEQNRFIEAQKAFYKSGHLEKSFQVLNRLLSNSIIENRFNDASYYSWLLANHHDQTVLQNILNTGDRSSDLANSERLNENAELYFVYQNIFKYIEEPFTSTYAEILFNCCLFLFQYIDSDLPDGISKVYILFALAKLSKTLGHYKLARKAFQKLKELRLPEKLSELIQIGSIEIRTKPFVDAEELSLFCYRCSSTTSILNSKLNRCINCLQKFIHSFYSFDVLPLIEFKLASNISHENFVRILERNANDYDSTNGNNSHYNENILRSENDFLQLQPSSSRKNSMIGTRTGLNSMLLEIDATHNNEYVSLEMDQIINLNDEIDPETNLAVVNERHLSKLNQINVIIVNSNGMDYVEDGQQVSSNAVNHHQPQQQQHLDHHNYRYYLNMVPQIRVVACTNCGKINQPDCQLQSARQQRRQQL